MQDWCRDKKLDRILMNELMYKFKGHALPCRDSGWVPYSDEKWEELATEKNFSPAIVRNIWRDMKKYTDGDKWLSGRVSAMNPTTDKSKDGKAPRIFYETLERYTEARVVGDMSGGTRAVYDCKHAESINDVCDALLSNVDTLYLLQLNPRRS